MDKTESYLASFILIFLAMIIGQFLYFVIADITIFIVGEILGYRFAYLYLWGIKIYRENGKIKLQSAKFLRNPSLLMSPPVNRSDTKKVIYESSPVFFGMLVVILAFLGAIHIRSHNGRFFILIILFSLSISLIWHAVSTLKIIKNIYGNGPEAVFWRENERVTDLINAGVQPKDIEFYCPEDGESFGSEKTVNNVMHRFYDMIRYYKALELGRFDEASYYVKKMEGILTMQWIPSHTLFYYEIIYFYAAVMKDLLKTESYFLKIDSILEKDMDINGRRVYAAYLFYTGKDRNKAMQVAEEGLKAMEQFPQKGLAYMEKDFILKMICEMKGGTLYG